MCRSRRNYMSYSLNSLKGGYIGDYIGTTMGVIKGDTGSLNFCSYVDMEDLGFGFKALVD